MRDYPVDCYRRSKPRRVTPIVGISAIDQKFFKPQKVEILRPYLHPAPLISGSGFWQPIRRFEFRILHRHLILYPAIHWP